MRRILGPCFLCVLVPLSLGAQSEEDLKTLRLPNVDVGALSMTARRAAQLKTVDQFGIFVDFQFADQLPESGITFVNEVTDDGKRHYKGVHYDHGNGVAVADVDGDGLDDIYFVTQIGRNELWRNLGDGKFENITEDAGVGLDDRISVTASFADTDNDGDPDLYVATVRMGNAFFVNDGKGRFRDATESSGLDYVGHPSSPLFFDYNNDGKLDCFLTVVGTYTTDVRGAGGYYVGVTDGFSGHLHPDRTEASILFENQGEGRFEDVTEKVELVEEGWAGDATIADFNGDGFMDLYVLNMQGDDHYYQNHEGRSFEEKTTELFPATPWGTMGVKVFDYDNDGLMDLILTDMHSDMSQEVGPNAEKLKSDIQYPLEYLQGGANNIFGNALYHNLGEGRFAEVSDELGVENYWPWGVSVGDLNADGFEDVLITSAMNFPYRYGVNSLLMNDGGTKFRDSEFILGIEPRRDSRTSKPWDVVDCSGADRAMPQCAGREGRFQVIGTLGSRSSAIFDLDRDGDLDIVTADYNSEPQIFISNLTEKKEIHFLEVDLIGSTSNRDAIGARVRVHAGGKVYQKINDGKSGYLSQSSVPLYFGLGDASRVDRIEIDWPSGTKQQVTDDINVNARNVISEP